MKINQLSKIDLGHLSQSGIEDKKQSYGYKLIDLGLPSGTLWMDRNIGAKSPTDFGLYFAWGETQGYTSDEVGETKQFSWTDYKYCNGAYNTFTKYCTKSEFGINGYTDNLVTLQTVDDAAYQFTNGKCRIPTKEQIQELLANTIYEWATMDGVNGGLFTSKINGKSIFITADGYCGSDSMNVVCEYGGLWSSSLYEGNPNESWILNFHCGGVCCYGDGYRYFGYSVRGVV